MKDRILAYLFGEGSWERADGIWSGIVLKDAREHAARNGISIALFVWLLFVAALDFGGESREVVYSTLFVGGPLAVLLGGSIMTDLYDRRRDSAREAHVEELLAQAKREAAARGEGVQ